MKGLILREMFTELKDNQIWLILQAENSTEAIIYNTSSLPMLINQLVKITHKFRWLKSISLTIMIKMWLLILQILRKWILNSTRTQSISSKVIIDLQIVISSKDLKQRHLIRKAKSSEKIYKIKLMLMILILLMKPLNLLMFDLFYKFLHKKKFIEEDVNYQQHLYFFVYNYI